MEYDPVFFSLLVYDPVRPSQPVLSTDFVYRYAPPL